MTALLLSVLLSADATGSAGFAIELPSGWVLVPAKRGSTKTEAAATIAAGGAWLTASDAHHKVVGTIVVEPINVALDIELGVIAGCERLRVGSRPDELASLSKSSVTATPLGDGCRAEVSTGIAGGGTREWRQIVTPFSPTQWLRISCRPGTDAPATLAACDAVVASLRATKRK